MNWLRRMLRTPLVATIAVNGCVTVNTPIPSVEDRVIFTPVVLEITRGTLTITSEDIQAVADGAAATPTDVRAVGFVEADLDRQQVGQQQSTLEPRREKEFLRLVEHFRLRSGHVAEGAIKKDVDVQDFLSSLNESVVPPARELFPPDDPAVRQLASAAAGKSAELAWKALGDFADRVYRRARIKSTAAEYLEFRARRTTFTKALQLTLQVGTVDKSPIILGRRAQVVSDRAERKPVDFDLVEENCSPERTVCTARYRSQTGTPSTKPLEEALALSESSWNELSVKVTLLLNGVLLDREYPAEFLVRRSERDDDGRSAPPPATPSEPMP